MSGAVAIVAVPEAIGCSAKSMGLRIKSAGAPSDEQLAAIRQYTLADLEADKLYVRTFALAHNAIDRDNECFGDDVLTAFARSLPGKGLHIKHPTGWDGDTGPAKGRWFGAQVVRMSHEEARTLLRAPDLKWPPDHADAALLMADAFMVRTAGNGDLLAEIDGGVAGDVSIGFTAKWPETVHDDEGNELTVRRWGLPAEALEGSLVWLGAQPGARAVKHASRNPQDPDTTKGNNVNVEQKLQAAEAKNGELEQQLATATPKAAKFDAIAKAVGAEEVGLLEQPAALADTLKAAKAYRDELVETIVAGERAANIVGDKDEDVAAAKAVYAEYSVDRLQKLAAHHAARTPAPKVTGSDPNADKDTTAKGAFHDNPALGGRAVAA